MITAILLSAQGKWAGRLRAILAEDASVLEVDPQDMPSTLPANVRVDVVLMEAEYVTDRAMAALTEIHRLHPESLAVCLASEDAAERGRAEGSLSPDLWIVEPISDLQLRTHMEAIKACVTARRRETRAALSPVVERGRSALVIPESGPPAGPTNALPRIVGRMTGSADIEQLLAAYCDAVHELSRCVSYCLLWQEAGEGQFRPVRAEGLPPVVEDICQLEPNDALPSWLQRNRGIVIYDALVETPDQSSVLQQLEMCGGVLAVPLFCRGLLRGIMVVGPKAIGSPYLASEAETMFMLSANAAAAAHQIELRCELASRNSYIDQVLSTMESGVVTINLESELCVCNPYAANVLRLEQDAVLGRDLRELPSPLGDHLYACLRYGEERTREEIPVFGGETVVRVSTRQLSSHQSALIGSMLLVEDVTTERALAEERRKVERGEVISQIVARFAHEIKNPLATINTFAELLPTHVQDPEFRGFWSDIVRRDIHRLDDLVAKLASLAEPPALNSASVEIAELMGLAIDRVVALDEDARPYINSTLNSSLPMVRVDVNVMAAALAHLLRYELGPDRQSVAVEAELEDGPDGERHVAISIRARDGKSSVEDPQQLLDPSYALEHPDIDLGPSASQRLIENQGGVLTAYREEDDIVFRVSLMPAESAVKTVTHGE